jgi:hypothetical protein
VLACPFDTNYVAKVLGILGFFRFAAHGVPAGECGCYRSLIVMGAEAVNAQAIEKR